jgi:hypothetical protein
VGGPREKFAETWNAARSLDEASARIRELVNGPAPRWALMARASELRGEGIALKKLPG